MDSMIPDCAFHPGPQGFPCRLCLLGKITLLETALAEEMKEHVVARKNLTYLQSQLFCPGLGLHAVPGGSEVVSVSPERVGDLVVQRDTLLTALKAARKLADVADHASLFYSELAEREGSGADRDAAKKLESEIAAFRAADAFTKIGGPR